VFFFIPIFGNRVLNVHGVKVPDRKARLYEECCPTWQPYNFNADEHDFCSRPDFTEHVATLESARCPRASVQPVLRTCCQSLFVHDGATIQQILPNLSPQPVLEHCAWNEPSNVVHYVSRSGGTLYRYSDKGWYGPRVCAWALATGASRRSEVVQHGDTFSEERVQASRNPLHFVLWDYWLSRESSVLIRYPELRRSIEARCHTAFQPAASNESTKKTSARLI
jgi:hypothetical protein